MSITSKPPKKKKKSVHYINPKEFKEYIVQYYNSDVISDELGNMILKLANGVGHAPNFINYSYNAEMIGDAVMKIVTALKRKKFDPDRGNPFSYFTKVAYHAMVNRIKVEKKNKQAIDSYKEDMYTRLMSGADCEHRVHVKPIGEDDFAYE